MISQERLAVLAGALAAAAASALAVGTLIHALVSYSVWVVVHRERGHIPALAGVAAVRGFIVVVLVEWFRTVALMLLFPFGLVTLPPLKRRLRAGQRPILLVHGYTQNHSNMFLLRARLKLAGLGPCYGVNLRPELASMTFLAGRLSTAIDRVQAATGATQVDVVAHSMGGLVTRLVAAWDEGTLPDVRELEGPRRGPARRRIRRIVTLGTPHQGTVIAHLAAGPNGEAMREGSGFLKMLPPPPPDQLVAISSLHDNIVIPSENARIGTADVVFADMGHFGLLTTAAAAAAVIGALWAPSALAETPTVVRPEAGAEQVDRVT